MSSFPETSSASIGAKSQCNQIWLIWTRNLPWWATSAQVNENGEILKLLLTGTNCGAARWTQGVTQNGNQDAKGRDVT